MGCRKNAYRALTAMSEWMEEQQQRADQHRVELAAAQRLLWPPEHVYLDCCPLWLADGPALGGRGGIGTGRQQRGCNGGCSKDHPRVTLTFADDAQNGSAIAIVSHDLKPFIDFFDDLCSHHRAQLLESSPQRRYRLEGFLRSHIQALEASTTIPSHLIRVSPTSLAASQRAEQRHVVRQEEARAADCQRKRPAIVNKDVLERVLDVCYFGLLEHLDVSSIAWMRLSGSPPIVKCAARLAKARMSQLSLTYRVLTELVDKEEWPASEQDTVGSLTFQKEPRHALYRQGETKIWVPVESTQFPHRTPRHLQLFLEPAPAAPETLFHKERRVACSWDDRISDRFFLSTPPGNFVRISPEPPPGSFFAVNAILWGFGDLLGLYARLALPGAKSHLRSVKSNRPASLTETNYVKALAREARFAAGDIRDCTETTTNGQI